MDKRFELPALESVQTNDRSALPLLIIYFSMIFPMGVLFVMSIIRYRAFLSIQVIVLVGVCVLLIAYVLLRALSGDTYYKTDSKGITLKSALRKRFVSWIEIEEAYTKEVTSDTLVVLKTSDATYTITPSALSGGRVMGDLIIASIRQHLGRQGKADNVKLTGTALSLWDTITDCVPREMYWTKPISMVERVSMVFLMLMFGGMLAGLWATSLGEKPGTIVMLAGLTAMVTMMFGVLLPIIFHKAVALTLRDDYIEAKLPLKRITMLWSEVTSGRWNNEGLLIFADKPRREIRIPWDKKSDDSSKLMLALIRRLRSAGVPQAVYIPDALRYFAKPAASSANTDAELRMSKPEVRFIRWGIAAFGFMLLTAAMCGVRKEPVMCGVVGIFTVAWLAFSGKICDSYYLKIDSESLTKGFLGFKTIVKWQDVANAQPRISHGGFYLKNAKGKTIFEISGGWGYPADRDKFNAALHARLDYTNENEEKPWLARPWVTE
ncbi:MAG: hypothetical protein NT018_09830 [Armatimonadetes bacterium]|nr:hypothetical protein [Armatimonadota bacterium]